MGTTFRRAVLAVAVLVASVGQAVAAKRVALVIGNNDYRNVTVLKKAVNDAQTIADTLENAGFEVIKVENVSRRAFSQSLQKMASTLEPGDEAVFYFAGHGIEIDGRNFLLPTDIPSAQPGQVEFIKSEAIAVDRVLEVLKSGGARVNVLILDACRDNPFKVYDRSLGGTRGLARMAAPAGTFIMYSAGVGQTALDRMSDDDPNPNSVYTRTLVPLLGRPGISLPQIARQVRQQVEKLAGTKQHLQRPAYYDELTGDYFLVAPKESTERPGGTDEPEFKTTLIGPGVAKKSALTGVAENDCDRLAGDPYDKQVIGSGVHYTVLAKTSLEAIRACRKAVAQEPEITRFAFQLGRALDADKRYQEARTWYRTAAAKGHAAARAYLGYLYAYGQGVARSPERAFKDFEAAARRGYLPAMFEIGELMRLGRGTPGDAKTAHQWHLKAAEAGLARSMNALGLNYDNGRGVRQDFEQARNWYLKAVDAGDLNAIYNIGFMHQYGRGTAKDLEEAHRWYRRAADKGLAVAMTAVGYFYGNGLGVAKDAREAHDWYLKGAKAGDTAAMVHLADAYWSGDVVSKDYKEAARWYRRAADKGNAVAMWRMNAIHVAGQGVPKDPAEAVRWTRKAAAAGHAAAMTQLGYYHDNGTRHVKQDYGKAKQLYEKAAAKGNNTAMNNLGFLYANGRGVAVDHSEAIKWYYKAAKKGNTVAMRNLADLYYSGKGGTRDHAETRKWHHEAAKHGDAVAMNLLANMYSSGEGGPKDLREARKWYTSAANGGNLWGMVNFARVLMNENNYAEARTWFEKAAKKDFTPALFWLGLLYDYPRGGFANPPLAADFMFRALKGGSKDAVTQMTQSSNNRSRRFKMEFQRRLQQAGLYSGRIDGAFGPSTNSAVMALAAGRGGVDRSRLIGGDASSRPPQTRR